MVPILRSRRKYLSCFYCGRRSDVQFTGQASFDCKKCESTNWLDEKGEITDPPTTSTACSDRPGMPQRGPEVQSHSFTVSTGAPTPTDSIFCAKCQRNQELVSMASAEFQFPEDPLSREYAVRVREYRAFRRRLEESHPQVCAECEPKVEEQLQKASYTAKTDHLRRMMDRTKARRRQVRRRGKLDYVDMSLEWTWNGAFLLQFLWHIIVLVSLLARYEGHDGHDGTLHWVLMFMRKLCTLVLAWSPQPDRIVLWSIRLSLPSALWNPRFKQSIRGFTAHITGFSQWYAYQVVIILIRCACLFLSQYDEAKGIPITTQMGAHLGIWSLMFYVYNVAGRSIRTDTTPLFGLRRNAQPTVSRPPAKSPKRSDDMAGILDDIMHASPKEIREGIDSPTSHVSPSRSFTPMSSPLAGSTRTPQLGGRGINNLAAFNLSSPPPTSSPLQEQRLVQNTDAMDWSPSGSQYRAFSNHNPYRVKNPNPRFSDMPIEAKPGPFWYKVPPAPTTPAQRIRNPPMKAIIKESPKEYPDNFFRNSPTRATLDLGSGSGFRSPEPSFTLRDPQFYAPGPKDDPRDGLSRLMGSFSISPEPDEYAAFANMESTDPTELQNRSKIRMAELIFLLGAFWAWVTALGTQEAYGVTLAVGAVLGFLIVSVRLAADMLVDQRIRDGREPSVFRFSWANLGVAQVLIALVLVWKVWTGSGVRVEDGVYGSAILGLMALHQVWHVFVY